MENYKQQTIYRAVGKMYRAPAWFDSPQPDIKRIYNSVKQSSSLYAKSCTSSKEIAWFLYFQ